MLEKREKVLASFDGMDQCSWLLRFLSGASPLHLRADKRALLQTSKGGAPCLSTSRRPVTAALVPMMLVVLLGGSGRHRVRQLQTWCHERAKEALPRVEAATVIAVAAALAGMAPVVLARRNAARQCQMLNGSAW